MIPAPASTFPGPDSTGRRIIAINVSWQPRANSRARHLRARLNATIRDFFARRGVLEVETPLREAVGNPDPQIESVAVGQTGRLRTSPEFALKRLVAAGSGPIYELGKVFRGEEQGRRHHPEFTMLEWYRPGFSLQALIEEVLALFAAAGQLAGRVNDVTQTRFDALLTGFLEQSLPAELVDRQRLLVSHCGVGAEDAANFSADECLDLMFSCATAALPRNQITVVTPFPAAQAALARLDPADPSLARRFEVFWGPLELANGYDELLDRQALEQRLNQQAGRRRQAAMAEVLPDPAFLAAHASGLPRCAGVSVGVDRLLMAVGGYDHLDDVLNFPEVWS